VARIAVPARTSSLVMLVVFFIGKDIERVCHESSAFSCRNMPMVDIFFRKSMIAQVFPNLAREIPDRNLSDAARKVFIPGTVSPVRPRAPSRFPTKPA
jgi:hypothetical protein